MKATWTKYDSGIRVLHISGGNTDAICKLLEESDAGSQWFACLFLSDPAIDPTELAETLRTRQPELDIYGCTTAGELTPEGILDSDVLIVLFPRSQFTLSPLVINNLAAEGMADIAQQVADLREAHVALTAGTDHDKCFALSFIDGMSNAEEAVTSAIFWGLDDIPLIGGSAGDHLQFRKTFVIADGTAWSGRAVILIISTAIPFQIFKSDNFIPSAKKLIVTASDPARRIVYEFNAGPAAQEYAAAIGIDPESLTPLSFASHPVVVRVGGEYFCRSIQKVNEDGSLTFFCAIDDGIVLTVAQARGMVESTRTTLQGIERQLGGIDMIFGFDCILRRLDAENRQVFRGMSELYTHYNVVGFGTYGEQYQSLHLNQTLTGIAFARTAKAAE